MHAVDDVELDNLIAVHLELDDDLHDDEHADDNDDEHEHADEQCNFDDELG